MIKLIHISDIHVNPGTLHGISPLVHFENALSHIEKYHHDADRIVITGDLTHHGDLESYQLLKARLSASSLKGNAVPRLMIGNHDKRDVFLSVFPQTKTDENGFVQYTEETAAGLFVYLDTVLLDDHRGEFCERRRHWLIAILEAARQKDQPIWLFMHHNPLAVHVANADQYNIVDESPLQDILAKYRQTIRHIFFGHTHYTLSGSVMGIPYSAPRSTSHPCWPEFSGDVSRTGYGPLDRNYNVCFLSKNEVVIHSIDYEKEAHLIWNTSS